MSSFFNPAGGLNLALLQDDKRLAGPIMRMDWEFYPLDAHNGESYRTPWWPRSSFDASGGEMIGDMMGYTGGFERPTLNSGAVSKLAFLGVSRDAYGSVLPSCVMKLFKTADNNYPDSRDRILDQQTSDSTTGAFTLVTPYAEAHYITLVKDGSPSVQGISVNTLLGA